MRVQIPVALLEFEENGDTIWVHSPQGATVLRIKARGGIKTEQCQNSPVSHSDIYLEGDVNFCLSGDVL